MRSSSLVDNNIVILGSLGVIGRQIALHLAKKGHSLILQSGSDLEGLKFFKTEIESISSNRVEIFVELAQNHELFVQKLSNFNFSQLIDCIGPWRRASIEETSSSDWIEITYTNLTFKGILASFLVDYYLKRGGGGIIFFGSTHSEGVKAYKTIAAYAAAKTGLSVIVKSIAKEYGGHNIQCNMINPGVLSMGQEKITDSDASWLSQNAAKNGKRVENLIEFLINEQNFYVNGAIINAGFGV